MNEPKKPSDDGGPAFPTTRTVRSKGMDQGGYPRTVTSVEDVHGMSLCDYFAGQALVGILSGYRAGVSRDLVESDIADAAFAIADAGIPIAQACYEIAEGMLEARKS